MNHKNQISDTYPLFDTFWNNTGLSGTVFEGRVYPRDEIQAKNDFSTLVSNITDSDNPLYKFISVK